MEPLGREPADGGAVAARGLHAQRRRVGQDQRGMRSARMKKIAAFLVALALCAPAFAVTKVIQLPPDTEQLKPNPKPSNTKTQAQNDANQTTENKLYQPATAPRGYWENMG